MEYKKLGDIATYINGYAFKPEDRGTEGLPIIRIQDLTGNAYDLGFYDGKHPEKIEINNGDVLISWSASLGVYVWNRGKALLNQHIFKVAFNKVDVDKNYFVYAVRHKLNEMAAKAHGATMKHIIKKDFDAIQIPFPSLQEQAEISLILDKVAHVIEERREELSKLDTLIKARFVEMFGNGHDGFCNTKKLGEFCKFQQGTQIPVEEQIEEQLEGYTRFLRIIDYTQAPQIPRYVSVKGREIAEDSVVIVRYGATAGFVGHGYAGILANNLFEVVPDESILSKDFLYLALKYGTFEQEVHDKAFGAAMPALSFGMMNDIGVVTPNSTAQNGFVDFVKQVDKSKATVQKALDETQLLFDSLMQQYFG